MNWSYEKLKALYALGVGYGTESTKTPYAITVAATKNPTTGSFWGGTPLRIGVRSKLLTFLHVNLFQCKKLYM